MSQSILEAKDFNQFVSLSEAANREQTLRSDEAFTAAMNREIKRGKVKVKAGTHIDTTPNFGARRIYADCLLSSCGSPAAMCLESSGAPNGAQAMR